MWTEKIVPKVMGITFDFYQIHKINIVRVTCICVSTCEKGPLGGEYLGVPNKTADSLK